MDNTREEFNRLKKYFPEMCGTVCVNCGSSDNIDYHHIVPLSCEGTNRYTNIVPLCMKCHGMTHNIMFNRTNVGGRPRRLPKNYKSVMDAYIVGEIDAKLAKHYLKIRGKYAKISDYCFYKQYFEDKGIRFYKRTGSKSNTYIRIIYWDGSCMEIKRGSNNELVRRLEWTRQ